MPIGLGPFDALAPLGSGGMGEVWRGVHRASGTPVALKILAGARLCGTSDALQRELRAVAALDHPHIVRVYDFGRVAQAASAGSPWPDGTPFLAMELLEGTLSEQPPADWPSLLAVLRALLAALAHAHARGVVHRDLKGSNVLRSRTSVVKLSDFGIAVAGDAGAGDSGEATSGTPTAMAPEQFSGAWRDFGPWTDLYALGCLAWRLVCGRPVFSAPHRARLAHLHLNVTAPPLEPRFAVPTGLDPWVSRLLCKRPEDRFQRAADAAWALERLGPAPAVLVGSARSDPDPEPPTETRTRTAVGEVESARAAPRLAPRLAAAAPPPHPAAWTEPLRAAGPPALWLDVGLGLVGLRAVPVVGHEALRDRLWAALGGTREGPRATALALMGESGVGKSHLAQWLAQRAHETGAATPLTLRFERDLDPARALAQMAARHLRCVGMSTPQARKRLLAAGVDDRDERLSLARLVGGEPTRSTERHAVVEQLLIRSTRSGRPALLWIDDAHLAPEALDLTRHLLQADPLPLLVVLTTQEPLDGVETLAVEPLDPAERAELARKLLGLAPGLADRVAERSAGNPLVAVQMVEAWVHGDALEPTPHGFTLREGLDALPDDLLGLWQARVSGLGEPVEIAAALGQDVTTLEWLAACDQAGHRPAPDLTSRLVEARLATLRQPGEAPGWRFVHPMLRAALEARARDSGRLADHHRACAEALEALGVPDLDARRGHHLAAAGEWEAALEPLTRAARALADAGEIPALGFLSDWRDAAVAALGLPASDPRRLEGDMVRAVLLMGRGDNAGALALALQVQAHARPLGLTELDARAALVVGRAHHYLGDLAASEEALVEAVGGFLDAPVERARALNDLGLTRLYRGDLDGSQEALESALELGLGHGHALAEARARLFLSVLAQHRGDLDLATSHARTSDEAFRRVDAMWGRAVVQNVLGEIARFSGDLDAAREHYREAVRLNRAVGGPAALIAATNLALVQVAQGHYAEAREALLRCADRATRRGMERTIAGCYTALLPCTAALEDWTEWDLAMGRGLDRLETLGAFEPDNAWAAGLAGDLAAGRGQLERARGAWRHGLRIYRHLGQEREAEALEAKLDRARPM